MPETANKTNNDHNCETAENVERRHGAILKMYGLNRTYGERAESSIKRRQPLAKKTVLVFVGIIALAGIIAGAVITSRDMLAQKEQDEYVAKQQRAAEAEEARRNRTEYAEIAFLDSLPEQVSISMDGKKMYAKTKDGAYTEMKAGKDTWIRYLPIKESTILRFGFEAEGFRPLSRQVAYYDWFPVKKDDITLQKVFRKIVMEPDMEPAIPNCEGDDCAWTVFREIMFRQKYAEVATSAIINPQDLAANRARVFAAHPALHAGTGLDPQAILQNEATLPAAAQNLLHYIDKHPFSLYGSITVESDVPDTRVFFLGEPLMIVKESGSMSQVKVGPDNPVTFATYGQGHPVVITEPMSIRLEAQGYPDYVTEILPHQWHCTIATESPALTPPAFTQLDDYKADLRHYLCDYSIRVRVDFAALREAASHKGQPDAADNTAPADKATPKT